MIPTCNTGDPSVNLITVLTDSDIITPSCSPTPPLDPPSIPESEITISDSVSSAFYMALCVPCANANPSAHQIVVGAASGPLHVSLELCDLLLLGIPIKSDHIFPKFYHNIDDVNWSF